MNGSLSIIEVTLSILLFVVMFFGIGFLLNMLLRMTWLMAIVYPVVVVLIIDDVSFTKYFTSPGMAFSRLGDKFMALHAADVMILSGGMAGAILAGLAMIILRKQGYQMF
ncbi:YuiB family protein [Bhargavaea ullalensis]|uniref:YuiB-like membrane protein n=1 Tax=Bhargavaea ullalensis TaxID=1265685 RepID=A0ABV2GF84_9BACL